MVTWGVFMLITKKEFSLLHLFAFLLPVKALLYEVGLQLMGFFIPLIILLVYELTVKKSRNMNVHIGWFVYIFYVVISTIIITNFFIPEFQTNHFGGYFREEGRYITYLIKVIFFQTGIFWVIYSLVENRQQILSLLKAYLLSLQTLAVIGILQVLIYIPTKFNITPIGLHRDGRIRHAIADLLVSGLGMPRVCSLGGEPKGLAASLAVGFVILLVAKKYNFQIIKRPGLWSNIFVVVLFLTLSTGGFGLLIIGLVTPYFLYLLLGQLKFRINKKALALIFVLVSLVVWKYEAFYRVIDARVISRAEDLADEDVDLAIQNFMRDQPQWTIFGSGSGNIHNLAYDYIKDRWIRRMMKGQIFVSRYGYVRIISENGFVGLFLFLIFVFSIPFTLAFMRESSDMGSFLLVLSVVLIFYYFARSRYVEAEMYFVLGLAAAWAKIISRRKLVAR